MNTGRANAGRATGGRATSGRATDEEPAWAQQAVDAAGGLDLLLTDAALGVLHRLRPDGSVLRLASGLARRPGLVGREASRLGGELARIAAGRSAITAPPRDRRFADPAWTVRRRTCLLYTSPSPRDRQKSRMPSSA